MIYMVKKGEMCPTCKRYYDRHVVVDGVVEKDGEILLIRRGLEPNKGKMALPGGYVDWDETTEEAVVREVYEETGVRASVKKLLGVYSDPHRDSSDMQNIAVAYILTVDDESELQPQEGEVLEVGWYDVENLPSDIAFDHKEFIADYLKLIRT